MRLRAFARRWVIVAILATLGLPQAAMPVAAQGAAAQQPAPVGPGDEALAALGVVFRDDIQAEEAQPEDEAQLRSLLDQSRPTIVDDATNDVSGTAPPPLPAQLADIQNAMVLDVPAADAASLGQFCTDSRAGLIAYCPPISLPDEAFTAVALQLGGFLPDPWVPPGRTSLYVGYGRPDASQPQKHDPFHAGIGDVIAVGLGRGGTWTPYAEGGALETDLPIIVLTKDSSGTVALIVAPTSLLANGFRPFVSIAAPPGGVADGALDHVDGSDPSGLIMPTAAPDEALTSVLAALDQDVATTALAVRPYVTAPFAFTLDGSAAAEPVDPLWASVGVLTQPGSAQTLDQQFPCDGSAAPGVSSACTPAGAPGSSLSNGPVDVFEAELDTPPSTGAGATPLQLTVALDADGQAGDNWKAPIGQPADPLQGTDREYQATDDPATGTWSLAVKQLAGSTWSDASSSARVVVDGPSVVFLVPASEASAPLPGWRIIEQSRDATPTPPSDAFMASVGGPLDGWSLAPVDDPLHLVKLPIAVTGGCVVAEAGLLPLLHWTASISGLDQISSPKLSVTLTIPLPASSGRKSVTAHLATIPINSGSADFAVQVMPGRIRLGKVLVEGGKSPIDVSSSWHAVFGSTLAVTAKGGQKAGNACG